MKMGSLNNFINISVGIMLALLPVTQSQAETITVGRGQGILWEGLPFNETLSMPMDITYVLPARGMATINTKNPGSCMAASELITLAGFTALPLKVQLYPQIGIIPRATANASYTRYSGDLETLTGTIGMPTTSGTAGGRSVSPPSGFGWCLPTSMVQWDPWYSKTGPRTVTLSGSWAIVASGYQTTGEYTIPALYFSSDNFTTIPSVLLLPETKVRVSTLECTVNAPQTVNFGGVVRNTQIGAELASQQIQMTTTCSQTSDRINANVNLQFRALSGIFQGNPSMLSLNQGGGYITGEISNGVTGSGACTSPAGIKFDNTLNKIGIMTSTGDASKTFTNQIVWRLCSGGNNLPTGAVTASTEMIVTFN